MESKPCLGCSDCDTPVSEMERCKREMSNTPILQRREIPPTENPLRRIRMALSMTLGDMARAAGQKTSTISEIERQVRNADQVEATEICEVVYSRLERLLLHHCDR